MASINMKSLVVGEQPPGYPADAYHYILMRILIAARAHDLQAIDGPYLQIRNAGGYREVARRAAALGFDGKWVLHPDQIAAANEIFSPSQEDYDHAELILDAYYWCTSEAGGAKGWAGSTSPPAAAGSRCAFELGIAYAQIRHTFGKPIAQHQAIQFKLAEMATKVGAAHQMVVMAARRKDSGHRNDLEAGMAKYLASEYGKEVVEDSFRIPRRRRLLQGIRD